MKIRFLQTIAGERFAFQAGRVYDVPRPTSDMLKWIDGVRAEVVRDEPQETAAVAVLEPEMAATHLPGRSGRRRR